MLTGNVVITQGTLTIRADRINFKQNADNSLSATAFGNPISFRQKRDDAEGYYEGWAQRAEYDGSKEQLELFDNAILKRGADEIRSNYISYNSTTELFRAEGRPSSPPTRRRRDRNDRVRGVFQPKERRRPPGKAPGSRRSRHTPPSADRPSGGANCAVARLNEFDVRQRLGAPARSATRRARSCTTSRSTSRAARSSASSGRTAPARRRAST